VKVLLDENFPLHLLSVLRSSGVEADHIITLDWRGVPDSVIRERVTGQDVLFVTQDVSDSGSRTVCPRPCVTRPPITANRRARVDLGARRTAAPKRIDGGALFELGDDGQLFPVEGDGE
jgi:hypothetical protein